MNSAKATGLGGSGTQVFHVTAACLPSVYFCVDVPLCLPVLGHHTVLLQSRPAVPSRAASDSGRGGKPGPGGSRLPSSESLTCSSGSVCTVTLPTTSDGNFVLVEFPACGASETSHRGQYSCLANPGSACSRLVSVGLHIGLPVFPVLLGLGCLCESPVRTGRFCLCPHLLPLLYWPRPAVPEHPVPLPVHLTCPAARCPSPVLARPPGRGQTPGRAHLAAHARRLPWKARLSWR